VPLCFRYFGPWKVILLIQILELIHSSAFYLPCDLFLPHESIRILGIHGFPPNGSKVTLRSYLIYFCTLGEVEYNPETHQTKKPTLQDVVGNVSNLFFFLISISMYSSFLYHYDYALFETRVEINSLDHTVLDMLSYGHIINNFSLAGKNLKRNHIVTTKSEDGKITHSYLIVFTLVLLQGLLKFFSILTGLLANIVFRVEVKEGIKNAMFDAKSPSDFWGKKWNLIVHNLLKVGYQSNY